MLQNFLEVHERNHDSMTEILQWTEDMILLPSHPLEPGAGPWSPGTITLMKVLNIFRVPDSTHDQCPCRERIRESTKRKKRRQRLMALEDPKHCGKLVNFKGTPKSSTHHPTPGIELRSGACLCLSELLNNRRYENIFNEINTRTWIKYECMAIDERSSVLLCMYNSKTSEVWKY